MTGRKAQGLSATKCTLSGSILPTGDFSVGVVPPRPNGDPHAFLAREERSEVEELVQVNAHGAALALDAELRSPLNSTMVSNSKTPPGRGPKGRKGITRKGAKKAKASVYLLEERYGRGNLTFMTLTLPGLSRGALQKINSSWGEVVNRLKAWLAIRLKRHGLEGRYVYVTEVQEKRLDATGDIALHLHMVFVGRPNRHSQWIVTPNDVREAWRRALAELTDEVTPDTTLMVNMQKVKKSVSGYLGKYLSKGAKTVDAIVDAGRAEELPSEWWGSGFPLKRYLKKRTLTLSEAACDLLWEMCLHGAPGEVLWCYPIMLELEEGRETHIGWSGTISKEFLAELTDSLNAD